MPVTLDQVDTYHAERGNTDWAAISEVPKRNSLLLKALDYVEGNYAPLVADAEETPRYLMAVALLALRISQKPDTDAAQPTVKSEKKEMRGMKKEVEYFEPASLDPFPGVTKLIAPLQKPAFVAPSVSFGKLVR
ncbi:hypothetical protein KRZ98_18260 [Sphingobium sp. AS12]|uniref:hypothetical protein n=1 Tax=Sphingobium sp. AS12 TaxID=2849495 RepID=UPI001C316201|nr:hypothetical protein [Sphingobium sp. AS12]MBV2150182.1 hypothetical protein [Sphingobium sp. AS12]